MTIHLLRTAAGINDLDELHAIQTHFRTRVDHVGGPVVVITTRRAPTRADEMLDGGSVYWIIRGSIQARQTIRDITTVLDPDGQSVCQILIDPAIMLVSPVPQPAIQGWRYLDPARAPRDTLAYRAGVEQGDTMPEHMARELKALGLL